MFEGANLLGRQVATQLGILQLLQVGQEVFLSLSALEVAILLGVHSQLKQFFVVFAIVPSVLVHLLLEVVKRIGDEGVRVGIGKLAALSLCQLQQFGIDSSRNLSALAQDHAPHGIVHHHEAALALFQGEKVHQRDVLHIL